jgi:hypothetical protein
VLLNKDKENAFNSSCIVTRICMTSHNGFVFISLFCLRPVSAVDFDMTGRKVYIGSDWCKADTWRERRISRVMAQQTDRLGKQKEKKKSLVPTLNG